MQGLKFLGALLLLIGGGYGLYWLYHFYLGKRYAQVVEPAEFMDQIRRVQVVDVREPAEFDRQHILGARNIPSSQFKVLYSELRSDRPIYLYSDSQERAARTAKILSKNGYSDVNIIKGGFEGWYGKTKSNG